MSFEEYQPKTPSKVNNLMVTLRVFTITDIARPENNHPGGGPDEIVREGNFTFDLVDSVGRIIESRSGSLLNNADLINNTSITINQLSAWMDELLALANGVTLPNP